MSKHRDSHLLNCNTTIALFPNCDYRLSYGNEISTDGGQRRVKWDTYVGGGCVYLQEFFNLHGRRFFSVSLLTFLFWSFSCDFSYWVLVSGVYGKIKPT